MKCYMHQPDSLRENQTRNILRDFDIKGITDQSSTEN